MRIESFIFFGIIFLTFSCTTGDNIRTYKLAKSVQVEVNNNIEKYDKNVTDELIWVMPKTWIPSSGSSMRIASFNVPYLNELGDLSVIKLGGSGGGIESNINRWRRQLSLEPLSLKEIEKDIINKNGHLGSYQIIQIINQNIESAFLCAIIPIDAYTIFVKLALKPEGIPIVIDDFSYFCSSINIPN